ncbi:MAG TPA: 2-isopropylmalate synthase [Verrucomicrobiae bacterium]|jgi:2-isopropylmalate synthase|nr:2-isopropylmalate synthase [Verrucomicrobiae bacterium]
MTPECAHITVFDTTLRDGEQSPGCSMNQQEKLRLAHQLDRLGVDVIEAGFPIASDGDFESVKAIAAVVRRPIIAGLARACRADIERAWEALKYAARPRIHVFLATSDIHLQYKLRITRDHCVAQARDAVRLAKSFCDDVEFSPEDATRTDPDFLIRILDAVVEAGATTLNIPDTVGYTVPAEFAELITTIRQRVKGIEKATISAHCHNDLGLAVANALAAVDAGARQVECTINGIGERAGNASLEEIIMAMRVRPDRHPYETGVVSEQIFPASQMLSEITGVPVQPNKAITGRNAFAHEAGIHQDGVLKNPLTYEIMTPKSVGVPDSKLVLGKHSGRHALGMRCEQLGYQFDRRALDDIYRRFVRLADKIKHVEDHHLLELIRETHKPSGSATPLIEPIAMAAAAQANIASPILAAESTKTFPEPHATNAFGVPMPIQHDAHHEQQQEDYLWGV